MSREGSHFRLTFRYDEELVKKARELPYSFFDDTSASWLSLVCAQSVQDLREMFYDGLLDVSPDSLIEAGEKLEDAPEAILRAGSERRPYIVTAARRNSVMSQRLRALPGATYSKEARGWSFGPQAAAGLAELVAQGRIGDPEGLFAQDGVLQISFDTRVGRFKVLHPDKRAQAAFDEYYPGRDVYAEWKEKGHEVAFTDNFTAEVYNSGLEIARGGIQPDGFIIDLYPYQRQGVAAGLARSGILIGDEPGLGKSAQAIGVGWVSLQEGAINRVVCVVPAHLRTQWSDEITKFCGDTDIVVIDGGPKQRAELYAQAADARWVIVHYDILHRDIAQVKPLTKGALLVVDEAHRIRNATTKRSKSVRELGRLAAKRVALSATAVENSPDEWYWVLSGLAVPGVLGNFKEFAERYMYPGRFGGYEGARNIKELAERSAPHFLRRHKTDVADWLPPLRLQHLPLDPDPAYAALLRRAHRDAKDEIAAQAAMQNAAAARHHADGLDFEEALDTTSGMTAVTMLRMLCSSPRLIQRSDSEAAEALIDAGLVPEEDGPKMDELRVLAAEYQAVGDRVVIFSSFKRMVELITERFSEDQIRYVVITGDTSRKDRDEAVRRFTDPNDDVTALVATDAAAEGLNLGKTCSTLVNVDIPWTAGRLEQRANRIHRLDGTHSSYRVVNMTVRGTVEDGILKRVERKEDLAQAIYGESGGRQRITGRNRSGRPAYLDAIEEATL